MAYVVFAAAYVVIFAAAGRLLSDYPVARTIFAAVALVVPPASIAAVIARRRREWLGCHRLFWDAFAVGMALWVVGHIGWVADALSRSGTNWLRWHAIFSLAGGIGPLVALLARPHRGARAASTGAVAVLIGGYAVFAVFIYAYFVLIPGLLPTGPGAQASLLGLVQVNRLLLMLGMIAGAWAARHTHWRRTYLLLAIGASIGFFLRLLTSYAIVTGSYASGTIYDLAWLMPYLLFLGAAVYCPASQPEVTEAPGPRPVAAAIPVLLIPLIGYSVLFVQPLGVTGDSVRALLTGVLTLGGLGLLTLRLSAQTTELHRVDQRARLLAAAIEQTGDAIVITRADGTIEHANDSFLRGVGYSREQLTHVTSADVTDAAFATMGGQIFTEVRRHGVWRGTLVRRRRDGSAFHASCTVVALHDAHGRISHLVGVERDITEDLNLRDQLVHAERLSAIGALVAGIAHEINNPLQTILGTAELLLDEQQATGGRRELDVVRREASRAAQIVRNLLSFVRRSTPDRAKADLNDVVRATIELRQYHLERINIRLDIQLHPEPLGVFVNREEIQQIVLNLILNAEHAIESTGRSGAIAIRTFQVGTLQCLEVADDGPGISRELRGKIFEPFFTTKDVGEGTGLGLSISHGIAFAHGGSLELCPSHATGACFRLMLPAEGTREALGPAPAAASTSSRVALVVDDEVPIRRVLGRLLQRRGYEIVEADSGESAVDLAQARQPQLIVCDLRMPGMSGVELYSLLSATMPQLRGRFIFMSGDTSQVHVEGLVDDVPVLPKPFSAAELDALLQKSGL